MIEDFATEGAGFYLPAPTGAVETARTQAPPSNPDNLSDERHYGKVQTWLRMSGPLENEAPTGIFTLTGQTQPNRPWILIPARGGSKGIPHKDIRPLGGSPLILHVLESCLQIADPSRVVVSTDDGIIASFSGRALPAPQEAGHLRGDEVTLDEVAADVARWLLDKLQQVQTCCSPYSRQVPFSPPCH